jgi:predicted aspartyl protease
MMVRLICGLLLAGVAMVSPAAAKDCGPLKMLASTSLVVSGNQYTVPVIANGSSKQFLLDTGGIYTQISPGAVSALGLIPDWGATKLYDVSGHVSSSYVKVAALTMAGVTGKDVYLRVSPSNVLGDGILALDMLNHFDVEMDFAGQKLNYFLPDHCPGKVIYWPHGDVAQVSITLADQRWIKVPVKLDGQSFMAVIDTGASRTIISTDTARETFNITDHTPGAEPAGNVNGDPNLASYFYKFSSLTLDGVTVKNPRILIVPDRWSDIDTTTPHGIILLAKPKRLTLPEVTLGMDVLKYLHLYFAFQEHNLYITAAAPPSLGVTAAPQ